MNQPSTEDKLRPRLPKRLTPIQSYALAVLLVSAALGGALLMESLHFREVGVPLFLLAVSVAAWYGGAGPAVLALVISCLSFDYFFVEPLHSLYVSLSDLPYFFTFAAFATLVSWFSTVRRRVEADLRQARDHLQIEVAERTQQASLLDLTHDTIFVRDMSDVITYWNRGSQELYGWRAEEAIGKNAYDLLRPVFPAPIEDLRAELLGSGRWEGELERTRKDGSRVTVSSRWSLRRDEQARPTAIMETNNDITERRRREREIRALNDELAKRSSDLEGMNKELEAFAYSISHDLRAPLRHMSGFTELLQKTAGSALNEKSQRYLGMIMDSAKRMGNLIDDLLSFSRIGRAETRKASVNLEELVQEVLTEVRQDALGRNILWKVGALPLCYGDRSMIRLALVNLVSNAVKFTRKREEAKVEIGSRYQPADQNTNQIVMFVRDNGVGFDMKYVNKLFGVFQRLHTSESFEGTGIGLATVQRIVHRHGGKVWAEGQVDNGATFYFSLSKSQESNL
jgi:PAS domain S-box-containing protein